MLAFMEQESYLPLSYGRIVVRKALAGGTIYSHLKKTGGDGDTVTADIVLFDGDGEELVRIETFSMKHVGGAAQERMTAGASDASKAAAPKAKKAKKADKPSSPVQASGQGIFPHEGIEVLRRTLSPTFRHPQAVISSRDLDAALAQVRKLTRQSLGNVGSGSATTVQSQSPQSIHPRPNLPTPFVAPTNEVETQLAEIWQQVLGLEEVGIHDNFFELGGDSVIGVQLVTRANEAGLELSPDQLFESQTVAEMAAVVGGDAGTTEAVVEEEVEDEGLGTDLGDDQLAAVFSQLDSVG